MRGRLFAFHHLSAIFLVVFFLTTYGNACAQSKELERFFYGVDSMLNRYSQGFEQTRLYIHTDKTIYSPNEMIWFSAYLLADENDTWPHQMLYAHLVRNGDDSLIRSVQYLINENRSYGDILIPNLTPGGDYRLIVYTDKLTGEMPAILYQQRIQIRRNTPPPFKLTATIDDPPGYPSDSLLLKLHYKPAHIVVGKIPVCQYELFSEGKRVSNGKLPIDFNGKLELPLLRSWVEKKPLRFRCRITPTFESSHTSEMEISYVSRKPRLRFFPEGGSLVMHTRGVLAMELVNGDGNPLSAPVDIFAGESLLVKTVSNREGIALATLVPEPGVTYTASLYYQGNEYRFPLPLAQPEGYQLQIFNSLATDTFRVRIARSESGMRVKLLLHNFKQLYWAAEIKTGLSETTFPVPLKLVPDGIYAFTLLDEKDRPVAERLVMRAGRPPDFILHTSQSKFKVRDSVSISMQLNSIDSLAKGTFSVSCAATSCLPAELSGNLLDAWFLADKFDRPLFNQLQLFRDGGPDSEKLNALLLTRGWRRYRWNEIASPPIISPPSALLPGRGRIIPSKKINGPFELAIFNTAQLQVIKTDSNGHFEIPIQQLVNNTSKQLYITPYKGKQESLLVWTDTVPKYILSKRGNWPVPAKSSIVKTEFIFNDRYFELPFGINILPEVVVVSMRTEKFISKDCMDYICHFNILNCENHPYERGVPVSGGIYYYRFRQGETAQPVQYVGCDGVIAQAPRDFTAITSINVPKDYYISDPRKSPSDLPEYNTTLYWNPMLKLASGKISNASFFCSDWKGRFRITVEGITSNGPIHVEKEIVVE